MSDPIDALIVRLEATLKRQEAAVAATKLQLDAARKMVKNESDFKARFPVK